MSSKLIDMDMYIVSLGSWSCLQPKQYTRVELGMNGTFAVLVKKGKGDSVCVGGVYISEKLTS